MQNTYALIYCTSVRKVYIEYSIVYIKANTLVVVVTIGFSLGTMARPKKSNSGYNREKDKQTSHHVRAL